jgi:hypothetical protein
LEALPYFLAFITTVIWLLFAPAAPKTTVASSAKWMSPIIISTTLALGFLIIHGCNGSPNFSLRKKTPIQQAVFNVVRSIACAGTVYLAFWYLWWKVVSSMFSELKPYNPDSEEPGSTLDDWISKGVGAVLLLLFGIVLSAGCSIPPTNDIKKLKDARKSRNLERLDGFEIQAFKDDDDDEEA